MWPDENFRYRFHKACLLKNMNGRSVAQAIGLHESAVSHWMTGLNRPTVPTLMRVAQLLDVRICWLMFDEGPMRAAKGAPLPIQHETNETAGIA